MEERVQKNVIAKTVKECNSKMHKLEKELITSQDDNVSNKFIMELQNWLENIKKTRLKV